MVWCDPVNHVSLYVLQQPLSTNILMPPYLSDVYSFRLTGKTSFKMTTGNASEYFLPGSYQVRPHLIPMTEPMWPSAKQTVSP